MNGRRKSIPDETKFLIATLYSGGMTARQVAQEIHIRTSTVSGVVNRLGIGRKPGNPIRDAEIVKLSQSGKSNTEISKIFNISCSTVSLVLSKHGINKYQRHYREAVGRKRLVPVVQRKEIYLERIKVGEKQYIDVTDTLFVDDDRNYYMVSL